MAKSKSKIIHRPFFPVIASILLFMSVISCSYSITHIQPEDFNSLKKAVYFHNTSNHSGFLKYVRSGIQERTYMELFQAGILLQKSGHFNESVFFFYASAFYKKGNNLLKRIYQLHQKRKIRILPLAIKELKNIKKNKSATPLAAEAIYEIAYSAYRLDFLKDAAALLKMAREKIDLTEPVKEKIDFLSARILKKQGKAQAQKKFMDLYQDTDKLIYLYYATESTHPQARARYRKILEEYPYRWLKSQAAKRLQSLARKSAQKLSNYEILLIQDCCANNAEQKINKDIYHQLDERSRYLFLKQSLRGISAKDTNSIDGWILKWKKLKSSTKEKNLLMSQLLEKLYAASRYKSVYGIYKKYSVAHTRARYLAVLSLYHSHSSEKIILEESCKYLSKNPESRNVARIYSDICASWFFAGEHKKSRECFQKLRMNEQYDNPFYSSRKRFYLSAMNKPAKSCENAKEYRKIFETYPDQYYGMLALKRSLDCKLNEPDQEPSSFWQNLEKDSQDALREMSAGEKIGVFFALSGDASRAADYLKKTDEQKRLLAYIDASVRTNYTFLAAQAFKKLRKLKKIRINPYKMNSFGRKIVFPVPYEEDVKKEAKKYKMDYTMVYAIMRQESSYLERARSSSNAKGLLQLLPSTAHLVNRKEKIPSLNLYNPQHNIRLGVRFFANMLNLFDADFRKAAAGYNGGPNYIRRLEKKKIYQSSFEFYESIPKFETYFYTQYTWYNYQAYRILYQKNE